VATFALPATAALAVWSATGTGDGASRALTAVDLQVSAGSPTPDMYPGATGAIVFSVTNPNPYPVTVTGGSVSSIAGLSGAAGTCSSSDFTLGAGTVASTAIASGATQTVTMTDALTMKATAGNGCQGVTVTVHGTLTGTQS
jgi:hypothetical protein